VRDELLNGEILNTLKEAQVVVETWYKNPEHLNKLRQLKQLRSGSSGHPQNWGAVPDTHKRKFRTTIELAPEICRCPIFLAIELSD
jgi:hypothetical protein